MTVEVLAGSVIAHRGARVGVAGGDLHVAQVYASVEHGCNERVPEHMGMKPADPDSGCLAEPPEPPGGGVAVHPRAVAVKQDRPGITVIRGAVDGPADRRGQRDQDDLAALPADSQDPVPVFLAQIADVRASGLEYPQAQQPEHGNQRKVVPIGRLAGGGEQRLELQVREPQGRRLSRNGRPADVLSWRVLQDTIDDAGPVEPGGDGEPPGNRRGLEPADLLHPPDVQLQMGAPGQEGIQAALGAPGEIAAQIRVGVLSGDALEPGKIGSHRELQPISMRDQSAGLGRD